MKKLIPKILGPIGCFLIGYAAEPGITKTLMAISGLFLVYRAGYLRAKNS